MIASDIRGPIYVDASALVKLYLPEPESNRIDALLRGRRDLYISDLAVTEIVSAAARKSRERILSRSHLTRLYRAILEDIEAEAFRRVDMVPEVHRAAERLLLAVDRVPLRAADALHIALALASGCPTLLTFDTRLADATAAAGLRPVS